MKRRLLLPLPGLLLCMLIALAATLIAARFGGPALLYALLGGMAFHFLSGKAWLAPGIGLSSRTVLRLGVALLGARISLDQILALGWTPLVLVLVAVPSTILFGVFCATRLGLSRSQGTLTGGSVAICGASAAMAVAAVLPGRPESERQLIFTIVGVTALSTIAMVLYPLVAELLGLSEQQAGFFLGGSIHDVAQVVGAGYMMSPAIGDIATFTKLLRVALLAPAVIVISLLISRNGGASSGGASLPGFLVAFAVLVAVNSLGWIPSSLQAPLEMLSRACLVVAIAAIGVKASFRELAASGWRAALLLILETLFLAALVLAGIHLLD